MEISSDSAQSMLTSTPKALFSPQETFGDPYRRDGDMDNLFKHVLDNVYSHAYILLGHILSQEAVYYARYAVQRLG